MNLPQVPGAILGYRRDGRPIRLIAGGDGTRDRITEIDARLEEVRTELLQLADADMDETQAARFDELEAEHRTLTEEREPLARRAEAIDRVRANAAGGVNGGRDVQIQTRRDPFEDLDTVRAGGVAAADLRARALTAIEQTPDYAGDDARENATRLIQRGDRHGRIARHMLLTGSDAYQRAFEAVLGGMQPWQLTGEEADAMRAAMSLTDANGGYLAPFFIDPTIILTNDGRTNPFRAISRVTSIATDEWHGITSAGVQATWTAEAAAATESNPAFDQPTIKPEKATAWLTGSLEVTEDTNIGAQVGMLLADARDQLEAEAFAVGDGSGKPKGVVTAVGAVAGSVVTTATLATYAVEDVYALKAAVKPRFRPNASWVASDAIQLATRQFGTANNYHAFWADLGMDTPPTLLGRPVYESSEMAGAEAAAQTSGALILLVGDFSRYLIVDRIGMTVQYDPLLKNSSGVPTGQVGWYAHWRVGADVVDANAFRVLKVQ